MLSNRSSTAGAVPCPNRSGTSACPNSPHRYGLLLVDPLGWVPPARSSQGPLGTSPTPWCASSALRKSYYSDVAFCSAVKTHSKNPGTHGAQLYGYTDSRNVRASDKTQTSLLGALFVGKPGPQFTTNALLTGGQQRRFVWFFHCCINRPPEWGDKNSCIINGITDSMTVISSGKLPGIAKVRYCFE